MKLRAIFPVAVLLFLVALTIATGYIISADNQHTPPASPLPQPVKPSPTKPTVSPVIIVLESTPTATLEPVIVKEVATPTATTWIKRVESGWALKLVKVMTPAENHYRLYPDGRPLTAIRGITDFSLDGKILFTIDFPKKVVEIPDAPDSVNPDIFYDTQEKFTRAYWKPRGTTLQYTVIIDQVAGVTVLIN